MPKNPEKKMPPKKKEEPKAVAPKKEVKKAPVKVAPKVEETAADDFLQKAKDALSRLTDIPVGDIPEPDGKGEHISGFCSDSDVLSWSGFTK